MFGENPEPKEMSALLWIHYVLTTTVITVVALNLLISIIGDTYDRA